MNHNRKIQKTERDSGFYTKFKTFFSLHEFLGKIFHTKIKIYIYIFQKVEKVKKKSEFPKLVRIESKLSEIAGSTLNSR